MYWMDDVGSSLCEYLDMHWELDWLALKWRAG